MLFSNPSDADSRTVFTGAHRGACARFRPEPNMAISKQTPEVKAAIVESVRNGAYAKHAAAAAGISEVTFHEWRNADAEFGEAIAQARAEAVNTNVQVIRDASDRDWRAAAWYLERTQPDDFREQKSTEHSGIVSLAQLAELADS